MARRGKGNQITGKIERRGGETGKALRHPTQKKGSEVTLRLEGANKKKKKKKLLKKKKPISPRMKLGAGRARGCSSGSVILLLKKGEVRTKEKELRGEWRDGGETAKGTLTK